MSVRVWAPIRVNNGISSTLSLTLIPTLTLVSFIKSTAVLGSASGLGLGSGSASGLGLGSGSGSGLGSWLEP